MKAINDKTDYKENCDAMTSIGFSPDERSTVWKIISAILHLVILIIAEINVEMRSYFFHIFC